MKDYPKTLNSRYDYNYVRQNFPKEQWAPDYQALLDEVYDWFFVRTLHDKEDGFEGPMHQIVAGVNSDGKTIFNQYEYRLNPGAKLFRLGFTVEEVAAILGVPVPTGMPNKKGIFGDVDDSPFVIKYPHQKESVVAVNE